jgi:hypothetical protein
MRLSVSAGGGLVTVGFLVRGVPANDNERDLETRKTRGLGQHRLVSTSEWSEIILGYLYVTRNYSRHATSETALLFLRSHVQVFSSVICFQLCVAYICSLRKSHVSR